MNSSLLPLAVVAAAIVSSNAIGQPRPDEASMTPVVAPEPITSNRDARTTSGLPARGDRTTPVTGPTIDVAKVDIAGVRLDMTPDEVRTALLANGFTLRATDATQPSWQARVSQAVAARGGSAPVASTIPMFVMAGKTDTQRVEVWFAATPDGARVASVNYQINADRLKSDAFRAAVLGKYGPATQIGYGKDMVWCSFGETACLSFGNLVRPWLKAEVGYALQTIKLGQGTAVSAARNGALKETIEHQAPKDTPPSF